MSLEWDIVPEIVGPYLMLSAPSFSFFSPSSLLHPIFLHSPKFGLPSGVVFPRFLAANIDLKTKQLSTHENLVVEHSFQKNGYPQQEKGCQRIDNRDKTIFSKKKKNSTIPTILISHFSLNSGKQLDGLNVRLHNSVTT